MGRKLLVLAAILCLLLPVSALSEPESETDAFSEYLLRLPLVDQNAKKYQVKAYRYNKDVFKEYGCGPASVTNALLAACDVEDEETADRLLLDVMNSLVYHERGKDSRIDLNYLERWKELDAEKYSSLYALLEPYGSACSVTAENQTADSAWNVLYPRIASGEETLWIGTMESTQQWGDILELVHRLYEEGAGNARVVLGRMSTGTEHTYGPFRLASGHFATLAFQPQNYFTTGNFYYLDSFYRYLPEEAAMSRKDNLSATYSLYVHPNEKLRRTHEVERVSRNILRIRLNEEEQEKVNALATWEERRDVLVPIFDKFQFYGACMVCVYLPPEGGES
ncbi:MAG: hypothetical protein IJ246_00470 [Clostridia bacterium]|nr:hypothetical protein [Clostridia bacterium]